MANKQIRVTATGAALVPYEKLEAFQQDIKHLDKLRYEKLRKSVLDNGFSFTVHVWKNRGKHHIIDGHQRIFTVGQLVKNEGYKCPPLPVSFVQAKNFAEAKRKVLAGASQYGTFDESALAKYLEENDIPYDEVVAAFDFPEVDMAALAQKMENTPVPTLPDVGDGETPEMRSSSDQVKQVVLFFTADKHDEFMKLCEALSNKWGLDNITDTVLEAVSAACKGEGVS